MHFVLEGIYGIAVLIFTRNGFVHGEVLIPALLVTRMYISQLCGRKLGPWLLHESFMIIVEV